MKCLQIFLILVSLLGCDDESPQLMKNPYSPEGEDTSGGSAFEYTKGARVGSANLLSAMDTCTGKGKFFDRAVVESLAEDATETQYSAACTDLALVKVKCTVDDILAHTKSKSKDESLNEKVENNIESIMAADYEIDQCLACPKGSEEEKCLIGTDNPAPPSLDIIRVFFVDKIGKTQNITTLL